MDGKTGELLTDAPEIIKLYMAQHISKRDPKVLFRYIQSICNNAEDLGQTVVAFSKEMTSKAMFGDAKEFTKYACEQITQALVFHEASRVSFVMQNYNDSIMYCQKAAQDERNQNSETFSDIARCIFELKDKKRAEDEGIINVDKALVINSRNANAWLNKGNLQQLLGYPQKAKECYKQATDIDSKCAGAITNLGNLLFEESQFEAAAYQYL